MLKYRFYLFIDRLILEKDDTRVNGTGQLKEIYGRKKSYGTVRHTFYHDGNGP